MNVKRIPLACKQRELGALYLAAIGFVDQVAMFVHPLAYRAKNFDRWLRDGAIAFRTDVQKVLAAVARAGEQVANYRLRRFPVIIGALITPTVVHGHTS